MLWGDGSAAAMAAADAAKAAVRTTANFDWTFITLLALVVVGVYVPQIKKKNWNGIFAALALYGVHWLYEIVNAVICHIWGYALWTVSPSSTTFILLIGVCWELSLMFSIAGFTADLLPEDKDKKILGINNRVFFAIGSALGFAIPFFLVSYLVYDMPRDKQKKVVGTLWICVAILLIVLIPLGVI